MSNKVGLEVQITGNTTSLQAALTKGMLEWSKNMNVDVPLDLKADPAEIKRVFEEILRIGGQYAKKLEQELKDTNLVPKQEDLRRQLNAFVIEHEKAFKKLEVFAGKSSDEIQKQLNDMVNPLGKTNAELISTKMKLNEIFSSLEETSKKGSKSLQNHKDKVDELRNAVSKAVQEQESLNSEYQKTNRILTQTSEATKRVQVETSKMLDGITESTIAGATGMAKQFKAALTSVGNDIKEVQRLSKKGWVNTDATVAQIKELEQNMDAIRNRMANSVGLMTKEQVAYTNRVLTDGENRINAWKQKVGDFTDSNARHGVINANRSAQTKTWDKIGRIDQRFSDAKQSMASGRASDVNLRSLSGSMGSLQSHINKLKQEQINHESVGNIAQAQATQELVTAAESKLRAHRQTYGSIANRFGSYDDAIRGQLSTVQATNAASVLNSRKGDMTRAVMLQGQGQLVDDSLLAKLGGYDAELAKSQLSLKSKLMSKTATQEELEEVKRMLQKVTEEREKHRIDMEKIAHKQAANEQKIQKANDSEQLKEQKKANAAKYADMVEHLAKNEHLIKSMSSKEARETRNMLKGARAAMGGDPDAIVTIAGLQDQLSARISDGSKPSFMDHMKKKLGFGGSSAFGNENLNPMHNLNHRITNVSQMMGTSLYGMGAVGLGGAIIGNSMQSAMEMETAKLTLAGMVNSYSQFVDAQGKSVTNAENLNKSLQYSDVLYGKLRDAAKTSLMTTGEITEGFLTGGPRLRNKGFSDDQALEITKKIMMLGRATGLTSTAIMSDIRDFAAGNVNTRSQVLMTAGIEKDKLQNAFKTGGSDAAFAYFQERMKSFDDAFKKIADTPAGQLNAFKIEIEQLAQTTGEKLAPILIPQLQKFRQLISEWVDSEQAEKFIISFGKFVEGIASAAIKFMEFAAPWVQDFNTLMTVTIVGIFATMASRMAMQSIAMSHPVSAILVTLGALVAGILKLQGMAEQRADNTMSAIYGIEKNPDVTASKDATRKKVRQLFVSGGIGSLESAEAYYRENIATIKKAEPFFNAFVENEKELRGGNFLDKGKAAFLDSMYSLAESAINPDYKGLMTDSQLADIEKRTGMKIGSKELIEAAKAVKKIRHGLDTDKISLGQTMNYGGLMDFKSKLESKRGQAMKNLGYQIGRNSDLSEQDQKAIRQEMFNLLDKEDFKAIPKTNNEFGEEEKAGKTRTPSMGPKLTTLEDVLKTYAKGQSDILQQRISSTSDLAVAGGTFLKPLLLGRGLSQSVTQAVSTWQESVVNNREKGPYAIAEANAQLANTMSQLRAAFVENIRTVMLNIQSQKEQNRAMRENIALQEKSNQLENAKFGLTQIRPYDVASGVDFVSRSMGVAGMQRSYSVMQAQGQYKGVLSEQEKANLQYLNESGLIGMLPADQQDMYRRAMAGDVQAIGMLPKGILGSNLSGFTRAAGTSMAIHNANRSGGAIDWKNNLKGIASSMGLRVSSEYRPGSKTHAKGTPSYHSQSDSTTKGLAIDFAGTKEQMAMFFDRVRSVYGDSAIRELIYTPRGAVFNGKFVKTFNKITMNDHYDHVHVALRSGQVDVNKVMGSQDRGESVMSGFAQGTNPVTGLPVVPYSTESMPPLVAEWLARNQEMADSVLSGATAGANNAYTSAVQGAFDQGVRPGLEQAQFRAQQALGLIGLRGTNLSDRLRLNRADSAVFAAQAEGNKYLFDRQIGFTGAVSAFDKNYKGGLLGREEDRKKFIEQYINETISGYGSIVDPANTGKAKIEDKIKLEAERRADLAAIAEKTAANLEKLAELDFTRLVDFVQNPYARINSVVNPVQDLVQRTQQSMEQSVAQGDLAVDSRMAEDKKNGIYEWIIGNDPQYYNRQRQKVRSNARNSASLTMQSKAMSAMLTGANNGVYGNLLGMDMFGLLSGRNNFDAAGMLSPLTSLGQNKFAQSSDILIGLMGGTLDKAQLLKDNPMLAGELQKRGISLAQYAKGNLLGKIGGNLAGNFIGNQLFAGKDPNAIASGTDIGGALAAAGTFGSKFMGPAGIIAGSVFGGLIGGLFGGKKANPDEERFRERQRQHFEKMEKMAEETNKLLRPSYDVYNTIKGDMLFGSSSRFFSNRAYSPLGNQLSTGAR